MQPLGDGLLCRTLPDSGHGDRSTSVYVPPDNGGAGTPLFLVPAMGLDGRSYSRIAEACRGRRSVFWSPPNRLPTSGGMQALAEFTLEHADRAGIGDRFVIGGASLGGMMAVQAALAAPGRIAGLVVIGAAPAWRLMGLPMRVARYFHPFIPRRPYHKVLARVLVPRLLPRRGGMDDVRALRTQLEHRTHGYIDAVIRAVTAYDVRKRLDEITAPTLLVQGERDPVAPLTAARRFADIPDLELTQVPRCGHLPHISRPDVCGPAIASFLRRVDDAEGRG